MSYVEQSSSTNTPANQALAAELRAEAAALGLSHKALAAKAGIAYGNIVKTMSSRRHTTATELLQLAHALNLTPAQLATRVVDRMGGMDALMNDSRSEVSEGAGNVTHLRPRTAEDVDTYAGDKAAYRDPEADTDED